MKLEDLTPRAKNFIKLYDRQFKEAEEADYFLHYPNVNYRKAAILQKKADKTQSSIERMALKLSDSEKEDIERYITVPIFEDWF